MRKIIFLVSLLFLANGPVFGDIKNNDKQEFIKVRIISRPITKANEIVPSINQDSRHFAIISEVLPNGIWEVGPDSKGLIATTSTISDLSSWHTHVVTQKCLELGGGYVESQMVEVNKKGLIDSIRVYETTFAGKIKYSYRSYNENYAVSTVIYGAGGPKIPEK